MKQKHRTRGHIIADQAIAYLITQVYKCGYTLHEIVRDYGIDYQIFTYDDDGSAQPGQILVQVKAVGASRAALHSSTIPVRVERAHLIRWLGELMPVILVVYDAGQETAFWVYVQASVRRVPGFAIGEIGATTTIRVPRANHLDDQAIRRFAIFRDRVLAQSREVVHRDD